MKKNTLVIEENYLLKESDFVLLGDWIEEQEAKSCTCTGFDSISEEEAGFLPPHKISAESFKLTAEIL